MPTVEVERRLLEDVCERMERARGLLRPEGNWGMLDTATLRAALAQPEPQCRRQRAGDDYVCDCKPGECPDTQATTIASHPMCEGDQSNASAGLKLTDVRIDNRSGGHGIMWIPGLSVSTQDDWITYDGSGMPVSRLANVYAKLRSGQEYTYTIKVCSLDWLHTGGPSDIIAYRVANEAVATQVPVTEAGAQDVGIREDAKLPAVATAPADAEGKMPAPPYNFSTWISIFKKSDPHTQEFNIGDMAACWYAGQRNKVLFADKIERDRDRLARDIRWALTDMEREVAARVAAESELAAMKRAAEAVELPAEPEFHPQSPWQHDELVRYVEWGRSLRQAATARIAALTMQLAEAHAILTNNGVQHEDHSHDGEESLTLTSRIECLLLNKESVETELDDALEDIVDLKKQLAERDAQLVALRDWLDNNTTFYNTEESDGPVLADVSMRIWYHATNDTESYPFSAVAEAARRSAP